jgi:hypothetical protein
MKKAFRLTIASCGLVLLNISTVVVEAQSYTNDFGVWNYTEQSPLWDTAVLGEWENLGSHLNNRFC